MKYYILEFQGPKDTNSFGGLAHFAHKNVRLSNKKVCFAHIHLFIKIIIIDTTTFNKKCLSPPLCEKCLDKEIVCPQGQTKGDSMTLYILYIYTGCPKKNETPYLLIISVTRYWIFKLFFLPKN